MCIRDRDYTREGIGTGNACVNDGHRQREKLGKVQRLEITK